MADEQIKNKIVIISIIVIIVMSGILVGYLFSDKFYCKHYPDRCNCVEKYHIHYDTDVDGDGKITWKDNSWTEEKCIKYQRK